MEPRSIVSNACLCDRRMIRLSGFPGAYGLPGRILMKMNCTVNMQDRERKSDEVINQKAVGDRIRAARLAAGMTQEELGEKLGVSFQAVSTWEQGKCLPDTDRLPELTKVLGCSMDSLFAEGEKNWKLKPVNYYAVKEMYIMAHIYTNSDLSENLVFFTRVEHERRTDKSDIFPLETETLKKALAKVGIIL